jgi:RND superfamily putative drug exporter
MLVSTGPGARSRGGIRAPGIFTRSEGDTVGNKHAYPAGSGGGRAAGRAGPAAGAGGPFGWLGRVVVRHPWRVIALWIVAAVAVIATSPGLPTTTNESSFLPSSYESIRASALQDTAFPQAGHVTAAAAIIVFARPGSGRLTAADSAKVTAIAKSLDARHIRNVTSITAGPPSPNRLVQTALVAMPNSVVNGTGTAAGQAVKTLRADIKPLMAGTGLTEGVTGAAAQQLDSQQSSDRADKIVLIATLGLILILLLLIFRSPIIALLPLIVIALVSQVATGVISDVNKALHLNADSSVSTILIVVLFGIGTDYILFLMFRYREHLRSGEDPKQAMASAVARVGEVIASAAGVVIVAFLALLLSTLSVLRSLGPTLAIAVAVTLLAGLTLIPAVVSLLGPRVFWPSKAWRHEPKTARFAAIGRALGRRPAVFALASGLLLVVLAAGALGYKPTFDLSSAGIPSNAESATALTTLEKGLPPGATDPTLVLLHSTSGRLPAAEVTAYGAKLRALSGVGAVAPPTLSTDGATAGYTVTLSYNPESTTAVNALKNKIRPGAHAAAPAGTFALVGGTTAVFADIQRAVNHDYAVVFPTAAVIILLILGLLLRSAVAPWYLMVSVGLGFGATLGASVLVFQGLDGQPGLVFLLPVYMYLFVVALGTDYNILMIARLREQAREGMAPRQAAAIAFGHAAPTIGAAGLILAGTFASLTLAGNTILSQLGFAVSSGIALAAFVMAMFFSPSLTALIGNRAWWPSRPDETRTPAPQAHPPA